MCCCDLKFGCDDSSYQCECATLREKGMRHEVREFQKEYHFLSNFHEAPVEYDSRIWPSVEHAYQAAKTKDRVQQMAILQAETPGEAKKLGRKCTVRPDWNEIKFQVMLDIVRQKFKDPDLKEALLCTGSAHLQEGNDWNDTYWGVDLKTGKGHNNLGKILMRVRLEIQDDDAKTT
jgi:ribA/ribD-fused uncharacterized protein